MALTARRRRVYPRVCGGTGLLLLRVVGLLGLSPRVRGNRVPFPAAGLGGGSIPACAGEPDCHLDAASHCRVYPRVCGGTTLRRLRPMVRSGLSPRVRGNRTDQHEAGMHMGSIPACAGEPAGRVGLHWSVRVYPRVCGGTGTNVPYAATHQGLSPRVRGNPRLLGQRLPRRGSIPACAGEPDDEWDACFAHGVYPRVCGGTALSALRWR